MRRGVGRSLSVESHGREWGRERPAQGHFNAPVPAMPLQAQAESRALIARFFIDLRQALRLTVPQAAHYLTVRPEVVEALETGQVEYLPPWPETSAIIMTYTSMAGINGRSVLNAIGVLFAELSVPAAPVPAAAAVAHRAPFQQGRPVQPYQAMVPQYTAQHYPVAQQSLPRLAQPRPIAQRASAPEVPQDVASFGLAVSSRNLLRAASAIASGARRLPQEALDQVRRRPQRALYAVSLPLVGLLMILMHSSIFATISAPFATVVQWGSTYFQEHYGPVRDGMRYIEVDDPRSRRADKLQIGGGSY